MAFELSPGFSLRAKVSILPRATHFSDHRRVVKKRVLKILNTRKEAVRTECYKDLLDFADRVSGYGLNAIAVLAVFESPDPEQIIHARMRDGEAGRSD